MIKDIKLPEVKNVTLAVAKEKNNLMQDEWKVYIINNNEVALENTLVASTGYGERDGENQKTSTLRHFLQTVPPHSAILIEPIDSAVQTVPPHSAILIEPIDSAVFHLNNEYWVSYYIGNQIYDKKFVFVPDTICDENLTFIKALDREGVLHS